MMDDEDPIAAIQAALAPQPTAPAMPASPLPAVAPTVSQDPRQKLAMLAALAAAIAGGPRSGLGGLPRGLMAGQQGLQQQANAQFQQQAQQQQLQQQQARDQEAARIRQEQRQEQAEQNRERIARDILADLNRTVPTIKDAQQYQAKIQEAAAGLAAVGKSRLSASSLQQQYPFVAVTTQDRLGKTAKDWLALNAAQIKEDPTVLDKAAIDFDLQDSGTPQRYPARVFLKQAGYQFLEGLNGEPLAIQPKNDLTGGEAVIRMKAAVAAFQQKNHRKPDEVEFQALVNEASKTPRTPAELAKQNLELEKLKRELGLVKPPEIPVGSPDYKRAQDVAYGRLTFAQLMRMYPSRAGAQSLKKEAIYDLASQLNPDFNAAEFEKGYRFASNPQTQRGLAAVDNVMPNIDKVIELSNSITRTDLPSVNAVLNAARFHLGDRKVTNFRQMQKLIGDEIGVALGAGTMTDMKLKLGLDVIDPNLGPAQFFAAMHNVKDFLVNRKRSLLNQMGPYGQPGMNPGVGTGPQPTHRYNPATGTVEPIQ